MRKIYSIITFIVFLLIIVFIYDIDIKAEENFNSIDAIQISHDLENYDSNILAGIDYLLSDEAQEKLNNGNFNTIFFEFQNLEVKANRVKLGLFEDDKEILINSEITTMYRVQNNALTVGNFYAGWITPKGADASLYDGLFGVPLTSYDLTDVTVNRVRIYTSFWHAWRGAVINIGSVYLGNVDAEYKIYDLTKIHNPFTNGYINFYNGEEGTNSNYYTQSEVYASNTLQGIDSIQIEHDLTEYTSSHYGGVDYLLTNDAVDLINDGEYNTIFFEFKNLKNTPNRVKLDLFEDDKVIEIDSADKIYRVQNDVLTIGSFYAGWLTPNGANAATYDGMFGIPLSSYDLTNVNINMIRIYTSFWAGWRGAVINIGSVYLGNVDEESKEINDLVCIHNPIADGYVDYFSGNAEDKDKYYKQSEIDINGTYNIVFDANGGSGTMDNLVVKFNDTTNIPENAYTNSGYKFIGWSSKQDGEVNYTVGQTVKNLSSVRNDNVTLYAIWELVDYKIIYNLNGGTNGNNPSSYNVESNITLEPAQKEGYTFEGWYQNSNFTGEAVTTLSNGITKDLILYAKFKPIIYTIEYKLDGGTNDENPTNYTIEDNIITLTDAYKQGYVFDGWYLNEDFSGEKVIEIDPKIASNITLYAKLVKLYTITFEENGGTEVTSITDIEGATIDKPEDPTKEGYTFKGWFTDEDLTNEYEFTTMPGEDITLYAKWEAISNESDDGDLIGLYIIIGSVVLILTAGGIYLYKVRR